MRVITGETCLELGRRARHRWATAPFEIGAVARGGPFEAVGIFGDVAGLAPEVLAILKNTLVRIVLRITSHTLSFMRDIDELCNGSTLYHTLHMNQ